MYIYQWIFIRRQTLPAFCSCCEHQIKVTTSHILLGINWTLLEDYAVRRVHNLDCGVFLMINLYLCLFGSLRQDPRRRLKRKPDVGHLPRMNCQVDHHGYPQGLRLSCSSPFLCFGIAAKRSWSSMHWSPRVRFTMSSKRCAAFSERYQNILKRGDM